jgi:hypothetical protein
MFFAQLFGFVTPVVAVVIRTKTMQLPVGSGMMVYTPLFCPSVQKNSQSTVLAASVPER